MFIDHISDLIMMYRNYPIPVIICDMKMVIQWHNQVLGSQFEFLTKTNSITEILQVRDINNILEQMVLQGCYTLKEVPALWKTQIHFSPVYHNQKVIGAMLTLYNTGNLLDVTGKIESSYLARNLWNQVGMFLYDMFSATEAMSLKGMFLHAHWINQYLRRIERSGYDILRLSSNLSEFLRLKNKLNNLKLLDFNPALWLQDILSYIQIMTETIAPIEIDLPTSISDIRIPIDTNLFQIAFFNLLHNSLCYTKPGNKICIKIIHQEANCFISISDKGLGIPKESLPYVYQPFYAYSENGFSLQMGLGISIAKKIMLLHGGDLTIRSNYRVGTTAVMRFPLNQNPNKFPRACDTVKNSLQDRFSHLYTHLTTMMPFSKTKE